MFRKRLHFITQKRKSDGYSHYYSYKKTKWSSFWENLQSDALSTRDGIMKQYVTTQTPSCFLSPSKHIMALDCDNFQNMTWATEWLFSRAIVHHVIESSPQRYWVICAKVGKFKPLISLASTIPGVDREYIKFCRCRKAFHLRAYPKYGYIPEFRGYYCDANAEVECQIDFHNWMDDFRNYWNWDGMRQVSTNLRRRAPYFNSSNSMQATPVELGDIYYETEPGILVLDWEDGKRIWKKRIFKIMEEYEEQLPESEIEPEIEPIVIRSAIQGIEV